MKSCIRVSLVSAIITASTLFASCCGAQAAASPAEQAGEMLARAQALNAKCNYLNGTNKAHLVQLVQQAERALSARVNSDVARAIIERGVKNGEKADCSAVEKRNLLSIVDAANSAAARNGSPSQDQFRQPVTAVPIDHPPLVSKTEPTKIAVAPAIAYPHFQQPLEVPAKQNFALPSEVNKPQQVLAPVMKASALTSHSPQLAPSRSDNGLQAYAYLTKAYFVARRCAANDGKGLSQMYQTIVASHDVLMRSHATGEVSSILRRSETEARGQGC